MTYRSMERRKGKIGRNNSDTTSDFRAGQLNEVNERGSRNTRVGRGGCKKTEILLLEGKISYHETPVVKAKTEKKRADLESQKKKREGEIDGMESMKVSISGLPSSRTTA